MLSPQPKYRRAIHPTHIGVAGRLYGHRFRIVKRRIRISKRTAPTIKVINTSPINTDKAHT
jgi:hypothetical protein